MLDGDVPSRQGDPHYTNQFYQSVQAFADASVRLCGEGKFEKLGQFLNVAGRLRREGNDTVKNGIVNIYLLTLARMMDLQVGVRKDVEPLMPKELRLEYARLHYISGL